MRNIIYSLIGLFLIFAANLVQAQTPTTGPVSLPPGGAVVLGPFGPADKLATVAGAPTVSVGRAILSAGNTLIIFEAPEGVDQIQDVTVSFKLAGDSDAGVPRQIIVRIDPAFSAATNSATAVALNWLLVLLIVALFIEGAVLAIVALARLWWRTGSPIKPSVYKPAFALGLSVLVVLAFRFDPLHDILSAFEGTEDGVILPQLRWIVDPVITALLLSGGAETVRRVATGLRNGLGVPPAIDVDKEAEAAEAKPTTG